jgi:CRISPR/Cas system-associated endoribonuclease Cas2
MTCIVSYDIESDSVRNRLSRFLEKKTDGQTVPAQAYSVR